MTPIRILSTLSCLLGLTAFCASAFSQGISRSTDLRRAVRGGEAERVRELLTGPESGQDGSNAGSLLGSAVRWYEYSAQHNNLWEQQRRLEIVRLLLEHGADPNALDKDGQSILYWDVHIAPEILRLLIAHGIDLKPKPRYKGDWSPLVRMVKYGEYANVQVMADAGMDLKQKDEHGWTLLMEAVTWPFSDCGPTSSDLQATEVAKILLKAGVALDAQDNAGDTALTLAARLHGPLVPFLVEAGADITLRNRRGVGPLTLAAWRGERDPGVQALIAHGAQVGPVEALLMHQEKRCLQLLKQGADLHGVGPRGENLLAIAAEQGNLRLVKRLLVMGMDIDATDAYGATPLILAVDYRSVWNSDPTSYFLQPLVSPADRQKLVAFLLEHGADINARTPDRSERYLYTALGIARRQNADGIVQMLQAHGAQEERVLNPNAPMLPGPTP